ncbi:hypothetical protein [Flagellimonas sp. CMM7]|uniref:hypothetical protein n=1 Tax=Flagellimonas sp. CMM7 TaxID=2654676 RepID=UPI0013D1E498|nr:hypothetical protein [Flagellimonas sp. CMM7]UII78762.1 hypothetical protein LV704_13960 [Flagellimonas sp. CMM7]
MHLELKELSEHISVGTGLKMNRVFYDDEWIGFCSDYRDVQHYHFFTHFADWKTLLCDKPIMEFRQCFGELNISHPIKIDHTPFTLNLDFIFSGVEKRPIKFGNFGVPHLQIKFNTDFKSWKDSFSFQEFRKRIVKNIIDSNLSSLENHKAYITLDPDTADCALKINCKYFKSYFEVLSLLISKIRKEYLKLIDEFNSGIRIDFEIDENLISACQRYLSYFVQFLRDIGIQAQTGIEQEPGKILFSIEPEDDKEETLKRIYEALYVYLKLPEGENINKITLIGKDPGIQEWIMVARGFQQEADFAKATAIQLQAALESKNATIQSQRATNINLSLSNEELLNKIKEYTKKENETESVVGELIQVTKKEYHGAIINWPEIVRRIKRVLPNSNKPKDTPPTI